MSDLLFIALVLIIIAIALCSASSVVKEGDLASCTTKKLTNSSLIVCTYKDKVLFNGEIKN